MHSAEFCTETISLLDAGDRRRC